MRKLTGFMGGVLELCGFHIRFFSPEWLVPEYKWLMTVQHVDEDYRSTMMVPVHENVDDKLISVLLEQQKHKFPTINILLGCVCGQHEPGVTQLELIRQRKEQAIIDQDFDLASQLRDQERESTS